MLADSVAVAMMEVLEAEVAVLSLTAGTKARANFWGLDHSGPRTATREESTT